MTCIALGAPHAHIHTRGTRIRGFTAVELMVTVAVVAILTAIALPALRTFVLNARRDSLVNGLVASLNYARSQALTLDQGAYFCPGTTAPTSTTCPGGAWTSGWELIATSIGATVAKQLAVHNLSSASTTPAIATVYGTTSLEFNGNGTATLTSSSATNTEEIIVICDSRGSSYARAVEINAAGYIQSSSTTGQAPDGTTLTCTST
jgi:type IV fimbrial biogenesis protein FimT